MALERVRHFARTRGDDVGHLFGALAKALDHFAGALVDDLVEVARLLVEGHFEDVGARGEAGVVLFKGRNQLVALIADHAVEGEEAGIDDGGDLVETRVELAEVL